MSLWGRWERWCAREEPAAGQYWTRTLVVALAVLQFLWVARYGLVGTVYRTWADGGLASQVARSYVLDDWFGSEGGVVGWWVLLAAFGASLAGVLPRWTLLLGVAAWAQLGHLYSPGDRAIDRVLRTALVILACGPVPTWADARAGRAVRAWPTDLMKWVMVLVYLSAGVGKVAATTEWLLPGDTPSLYRAVADPLSGNLDPVAAARWMWVWKVGGYFTILLELTSPLLLTRWARVWGAVAIAMHLGIALTMDLGWFPYGMIVLYAGVFARGRVGFPPN